MPFDIATVGRNRDQALMRAVVVQPFDELTELLGLFVGEPLPRHDGVDGCGELRGGAEPLPAAPTHSHGVADRLVADLADRVERELSWRLPVRGDPHLVTRRPADAGECLRVGRAVLRMVDQVLLLGRERLAHRSLECSHATLLTSYRLGAVGPVCRFSWPGRCCRCLRWLRPEPVRAVFAAACRPGRGALRQPVRRTGWRPPCSRNGPSGCAHRRRTAGPGTVRSAPYR